MKQRKFRSKKAADNFAKVTGYRAVKKKSTKLKDGTKANWYAFIKLKTAKKKKKK